MTPEHYFYLLSGCNVSSRLLTELEADALETIWISIKEGLFIWLIDCVQISVVGLESQAIKLELEIKEFSFLLVQRLSARS